MADLPPLVRTPALAVERLDLVPLFIQDRHVIAVSRWTREHSELLLPGIFFSCVISLKNTVMLNLERRLNYS